MSLRRLALPLAFVLGIAVAFAIGQTSTTSKSTPTRWVGKMCTVYLRVESDPRVGRTAAGGDVSYGVERYEGIPISVTGTLNETPTDAVIISRDGQEIWIPLSQVRAIQTLPSK